MTDDDIPPGLLALLEGAIALHDAGRAEEAAAACRTAAERFAEEPHAHLIRAEIAVSHDPAEAQRSASSAARLAPDDAVVLSRAALVFRRLDADDEARSLTERAVEAETEEGEGGAMLEWLRATFAWGDGRAGEADRRYRRAASLDDDYIAPLAEFLVWRGHSHEALDVIEEALRRLPGDQSLLEVLALAQAGHQRPGSVTARGATVTWSRLPPEP